MLACVLAYLLTYYLLTYLLTYSGDARHVLMMLSERGPGDIFENSWLHVGKYDHLDAEISPASPSRAWAQLTHNGIADTRAPRGGGKRCVNCFQAAMANISADVSADVSASASSDHLSARVSRRISRRVRVCTAGEGFGHPVQSSDHRRAIVLHHAQLVRLITTTQMIS